MSGEEQYVAEKRMFIATRMLAISSILAKQETTEDDRKQLKDHLLVLRNISIGKDVGLSQEIAAIAKAVALKIKAEVEKSQPDAGGHLAVSK